MRIRAEVLLTAAACVVGSAVVSFAPIAQARADPDCAAGQPASPRCTHGYCPSGEVVSASGDCGLDQSVYAPQQQAPAPPPLVGFI